MFHYIVGPFVIKSILAFPIVEKLLEIMKFQESQKISYAPRKIIEAGNMPASVDLLNTSKLKV